MDGSNASETQQTGSSQTDKFIVHRHRYSQRAGSDQKPSRAHFNVYYCI